MQTAMEKTLRDIEKYPKPHGKTLSNYDILPANISENDGDNDDEEEMANTAFLSQKEPLLNASQRHIYDTVNRVCVKEINQRLFFIDGPGGYRNTFLLNVIIAKEKSNQGTVIAVASSGIAALLLDGGRTAHSTFKIPLQLTEDSVLNVKPDSELARLIKRATLIIWDEAPMMHRFAFEAVDKSIRDLTGSDKPFGDKVVVLGGDFRQILPVVIQGSRSHIIDACIKSSKLWQDVTVMRLTTNMRVQNEEQKQFVDYLLRIGEGKKSVYGEVGEDMVKLPDEMIINDESVDSLISEVFGDLNEKYKSADNFVNYIKNRAILTSKNKDVDAINERVIKNFDKDEPTHVFLSADSVEDRDSVHQNLYPVEFLNTLTPSGTPPHRLVLKVGAPIILLRNLSPAEGLCNGTRLIVRGLQQHVIDAEIVTGSHCEKRVYIPRIRIVPSDADLPFQLICRQFPVRLAFAMTINKAQGQTIPHMGLYLPDHVFTHGQLYVALSRVQSKDNIKILVKKGKIDGGVYTKNIVYKEIF